MLCLAHTITQRIGRVVGQYRDAGLHDGGAAIQLFGNEVDSSTMLAITRFQCALVGMQTRVFGQQGRMDVQQPSLVVDDKISGKNAHETGQNDPLRFMGINQLGQCPVITDPIGKLAMIQHSGGNAGFGSPLQPVGIRAVGNHRDDVGLIRMQAINERLQIAA